jgi:hypothetical protein
MTPDRLIIAIVLTVAILSAFVGYLIGRYQARIQDEDEMFVLRGQVAQAQAKVLGFHKALMKDAERIEELEWLYGPRRPAVRHEALREETQWMPTVGWNGSSLWMHLATSAEARDREPLATVSSTVSSPTRVERLPGVRPVSFTRTTT